MPRPGPKPTCVCGTCAVCRRREVARRQYYGLPGLNPRRFRRPTLTLPSTPSELGYLAGLLDGEGCITKNNGRWRVQIAMTNESVIRWLGTIGGTVRERQVVGNRRPCWRWLLMRQTDVRAFLVAVLPLLKVKREHVAAVVTEIDAAGIPDALERVA